MSAINEKLLTLSEAIKAPGETEAEMLKAHPIRDDITYESLTLPLCLFGLTNASQ